MCLSFSFQELGHDLFSEDAWFTPIALRTDMMNQVSGGWSCMLKEFLKALLLGPSGFQTAGVALELRGRPALIHARVGQLLSDGDGLRIALQWMGQ